MITKNSSINYTTSPKQETKINESGIVDLIKLLKKFKFSIINDQYGFIYENLEIFISNNGNVHLFLISTSGYDKDIALLARFADKLNSIIGIKHYSGKFIA